MRAVVVLHEQIVEKRWLMLDLRLEVVVVPVSDVDRAKAFYEKAGFNVDVDARPNDELRSVQMTPPGRAGRARRAANRDQRNPDIRPGSSRVPTCRGRSGGVQRLRLLQRSGRQRV